MSPIFDELSRLDKENGGLTPEILLRAAKPKTSPLHGQFTWDNVRAANDWRLYEARQLLGRYKIRVVEDGEPKHVRAFIHVPAEDRWRSIEDVRSDHVRLQSVVEAAGRDLRAFRRKYEALIEVVEMRALLGEVFELDGELV
jgi:hypothetical protein